MRNVDELICETHDCIYTYADLGTVHYIKVQLVTKTPLPRELSPPPSFLFVPYKRMDRVYCIIKDYDIKDSDTEIQRLSRLSRIADSFCASLYLFKVEVRGCKIWSLHYLFSEYGS